MQPSVHRSKRIARCPQPGEGDRITLRHDQCYVKHEGAEASFVVKLSMSLRSQKSRKRVQVLVLALMSVATLLAACQPNHNPTPSPVPRVPTPSPEPNREPERPVKPQTTAAASTHLLAQTA